MSQTNQSSLGVLLSKLFASVGDDIDILPFKLDVYSGTDGLKTVNYLEKRGYVRIGTLPEQIKKIGSVLVRENKEYYDAFFELVFHEGLVRAGISDEEQHSILMKKDRDLVKQAEKIGLLLKLFFYLVEEEVFESILFKNYLLVVSADYDVMVREVVSEGGKAFISENDGSKFYYPVC